MVRAVNDGNETVPTAVVAGRPGTNPDVEWVREQLSRSVRSTVSRADGSRPVVPRCPYRTL